MELREVWYCSAVAISVAFVIGTFIGEAKWSNSFVVQKLLLTRENNPAALWSGLLLALVAIHAYDGYALWRRQQVEVAKAWLSIGLLLLILSADEVGSIHERVGVFGEQIGIGPWIPLLPFAIILGAVFGYAVVLLWRTEGQRRTAMVVLLGFLLLGSAAPQEVVEHHFVFASNIAHAIRATLEEGTELAGMLLLLKVAMANTAFSDRREFKTLPCLEALHALCVPVTVMALLLAPLLAAGTAMYENPAWGRPADWLATVLLLGAALAACRPYLRGEGSRWPAWILIGTCGIAALVIVEMEPDKIVWLGPVSATMRLLVLGVLSPIAIVAWGLLHGRRSMWLHLLAVAVMADLFALAFLPVGATFVYGVTQLLTLAIYVAQVSEAGTWEPAATAEPLAR
jgi:hypothetical protein